NESVCASWYFRGDKAASGGDEPEYRIKSANESSGASGSRSRLSASCLNRSSTEIRSPMFGIPCAVRAGRTGAQLMNKHLSERLRLAVLEPGNFVDAPSIHYLDQIEHDSHWLS